MLEIKRLKEKLLLTAIILGIIALLCLCDMPCPIQRLTGINCLGCGMTRAVFSAIRLDFIAAFNYHKMFWSLPILYLCFLKDGRLFKNKVLNVIFYSLTLLGFVFNWLLSIF